MARVISRVTMLLWQGNTRCKGDHSASVCSVSSTIYCPTYLVFECPFRCPLFFFFHKFIQLIFGWTQFLASLLHWLHWPLFNWLVKIEPDFEDDFTIMVTNIFALDISLSLSHSHSVCIEHVQISISWTEHQNKNKPKSVNQMSIGLVWPIFLDAGSSLLLLPFSISLLFTWMCK